MLARHRLRTIPVIALAAVGLTVLATAPAGAAAPGAAAPGDAALGGAAFYTPPAELPATNGDLVRHRPATVAYLGVPATTIMYKSTDANGEAVAVTGTVLQATAPWRGGGDRPLISYAVGTIGQGDQCAPSVLLGQGLEYEAITLPSLLAAGANVVVTDYLGLGTPDRVHSYLNPVEEAHAVLDAATAAQNLGREVPGLDVPADGPVGIYGYSQGGQAAGAAAELHSTYAPQVNLVGSAVGAPPADVVPVAMGSDGTILSGALGYAINSLAANDPQLAAAFDARLNQRGKDFVQAVRTQCLGETILRFGFQQSGQYTVDGQPFTSFLFTEPFASALADLRVGRHTPDAPVYLWSGTNDDVVPIGQVRQLAADWCAQPGTRVQLQEITLPAVFPGVGIGHALPFVLGAPDAQRWLYERFVAAATGSTGPAPSTCAPQG
ncbi:lipase family protein [Rhodococcus sp. X156]|uniref:lipase family protein n=1 Tax=Rhodococcus sp. X156 TaxID=2499145 RepID=UPI000FDA1233|nr:lipase family protein [Rhodococcus sp. X156]